MPSGDPPDGTERCAARAEIALLHASVTPVPLGGSPSGAGGSPAPPAAASQWSLAGVEVSGLIDAYYSLNFNHPASGVNQSRNFDLKGNNISLNMAKMTLERAPAPKPHQASAERRRREMARRQAEPHDPVQAQHALRRQGIGGRDESDRQPAQLTSPT